MSRTRWFLLAYACSGLAGLIYEVAWARLLTLYMGHTTAATSTVVAAFMGGLALGAALGGRRAIHLSPRQALLGYAALEGVVVLTALAIPFELRALTPVLQWAYRDGAGGAFFPSVRMIACLLILLPPTLALGATFPLAVRWFAAAPARSRGAGGVLYAVNTAGAAAGALASGFFLIPAIGATGTTLSGVAASAAAIVLVVWIARHESGERAVAPARAQRSTRGAAPKATAATGRPWLAAVVVTCTGFATFLYEITWARVFSTLIGPSTYAFAATLTGLIAGVAVGSAFGAVLARRTTKPALWLAVALGAVAMVATLTSSYAGTEFPRFLIRELAGSPRPLGELLFGHSLRVAALVATAAVGLGVAFPLALEVAGSGDPHVARRFGAIYALNTVASVAGSLTAGFVAIPLLGLQDTLHLASAVLLVGSVVVVVWGGLSTRARVGSLIPAAVTACLMVVNPRWDRALLASGAYKYAAQLPKDLDLETSLKAGTLEYYREGAGGIVSVNRLTGYLALAIDGKVDASTSGDMLTQKTLAQLPMLLHGDPRTVCIIGLGSGVTLASALTHPVESVDVVEISPEVVEASQYFAEHNRHALSDPRTRLILGDGRSHLALSDRQYDVIVSEPSNPWMAGVASLFTREFFTAVRSRLKPGGILCQWAHTYDISEQDLRSVVRTFASVFPNGTMWLIGGGDLLLVGSDQPLDSRLSNIHTGWQHAAVADDLRGVSMREPFGLWSLYVGGPDQLARFGDDAPYQTDDRMALEFSGPSAVNTGDTRTNAATIARLLDGVARPETIARVLANAGAPQWRDRAAMMFAANAYEPSFEDYAHALSLDPTDAQTLTGLVPAAVAAHREPEAADLLTKAIAKNPTKPGPRVALSKLRAGSGDFEEALKVAKEACLIEPSDPTALEQLASLYADTGDATGLDAAAEGLQQLFPECAATRYYRAASHFLHGRFREAQTDVQAAIALDNGRATFYNLLGAIHANLDEREKAREAFESALRLDPRDVATYTNLATLELSSGNRTQAADLFAEALSLDPSSMAARQGLAETR